MTITKLILMMVCLMSVTIEAKEAKVTQLLSDIPGKEGLMITVEYPPGSSDPIHRHNAHGFIRRAVRTQYIATMHMGLFMC